MKKEVRYMRLALEEELVLSSQTATMCAGLDKDLNEALRSVDISNALEELAVVATEIQYATDAETKLIEAFGNVAVAGTSVRSDKLIPDQSYSLGQTVSVEGFKEAAVKIWEAVKAAIKAILTKIENFFKDSMIVMVSTKMRLQAYLKEVSKYSDQPIPGAESFQYIPERMGDALRIQGHLIRGVADINTGLESLTKLVRHTFDAYPEIILDIAERVTDGIGEVTLDNADVKLVQLCEYMDKALPQAFNFPIDDNKSAHTEKESGTTFIHVMTRSLGNLDLDIILPGLVPQETPVSYFERIKHAKVSVEPSGLKAKMITTPITEPLKPTEIVIILRKLIELYDVMIASKSVFYKGTLDKQVKRLQETTDKVINTVVASPGADSADMVEHESIRSIKAIANLNLALASWVKNPAVDVTNQVTIISRALLVYIKRSIEVYQPRGSSQGSKEKDA